MSVSYTTFSRTATAELLASGLQAKVCRDDKEWWLQFTDDKSGTIINIPVIRMHLDTRADVAGFVGQAVAMAKEEFEAAGIAIEIDRNLGRMYQP